jgi:hypothetical protein
VPLDPFQERIARMALALPEARTLALAGGGAMIVHGFIDRATRDVDLFTEVDSAEAERVALALQTALERRGLRTVVSGGSPPNRFVVTDPTQVGRSKSKSFLTAVGSVQLAGWISDRCCTRTTSPLTRCWPSGGGQRSATTSTSPHSARTTPRIGSCN